MPRRKAKPTGLVVCMPSRDTPSDVTRACFRDNMDGYPNVLLTVVGKGVVEAANVLFRQATELDAERLSFEPILMVVADDAWWGPGTVERAVTLLEANQEVDILTGIVSHRKPFGEPLGVTLSGDALTLLRYKPGEMIPLRYGPLHWAFIRPRVISLLRDCQAPFDLYRTTDKCVVEGKEVSVTFQLTEEKAFLRRAAAKGAKIATERTLIVGHVEPETGQMFQPYRGTLISNGSGYPSEASGTKFVVPKQRSYYTAEEESSFGRDTIAETSDGTRIIIPMQSVTKLLSPKPKTPRLAAG